MNKTNLNAATRTLPGLSAEKTPTDKQRVAAAVKNLHGCMNELLKAGRVASMEAASVVIDDFKVLMQRLDEIDSLTAEVARLREQASALLQELEAAKQEKQ